MIDNESKEFIEAFKNLLNSQQERLEVINLILSAPQDVLQKLESTDGEQDE